MELLLLIIGSLLVFYAIHVINKNKYLKLYAVGISSIGLLLNVATGLILLSGLSTTTHLNHSTFVYLILCTVIGGSSLLGEIVFCIKLFKVSHNKAK